MTFNNLLSTSEACVYLQVSRTTLMRLVESGRIPAPLKVSARRNLWRECDLDQYYVSEIDRVEAASPVIDVDADGRDADGNSYDMLPTREALDAGLVEGRNVRLRYPGGLTLNGCEVLITEKSMAILKANLSPDAFNGR